MGITESGWQRYQLPVPLFLHWKTPSGDGATLLDVPVFDHHLLFAGTDVHGRTFLGLLLLEIVKRGGETRGTGRFGVI